MMMMMIHIFLYIQKIDPLEDEREIDVEGIECLKGMLVFIQCIQIFKICWKVIVLFEIINAFNFN